MIEKEPVCPICGHALDVRILSTIATLNFLCKNCDARIVTILRWDY